MAEKMKECAVVVSQEKIAQDIYSMWIQTKEIASYAKAGQFISIYCKDGSRLLPRPISICEIDKEKQRLRIVYRTVGGGTHEFSHYVSGTQIDILGPLGNGFTLHGKKALLVAGGIGIPPMLELAKNLTGEKQIVVGYRDEVFLLDELEQYADVYAATESGSVGIKGTVLDVILEYQLDADVIYACGPVPMLRAVSAYAAEKKIEAQISMEEKMACGIGACLACVCRTKETDLHTNVKNKRICKDGPVFDADEIVIE